MEEDMLKVLCGIGNTKPQIAPQLSLQDQRVYLIKNVNHLTYENKIELARILRDADLMNKVSDCNEGVAIDMNIDPAIIEKMYNFAYFKLNRQ